MFNIKTKRASTQNIAFFAEKIIIPKLPDKELPHSPEASETGLSFKWQVGQRFTYLEAMSPREPADVLKLGRVRECRGKSQSLEGEHGEGRVQRVEPDVRLGAIGRS